jgi:methionine biosynthesis protein MetW
VCKAVRVPSLHGLRRQLQALSAPAPMHDFRDYDDYWERRGELRVVHNRWTIAAGWIPNGATLLDIGCGSGEFLRYLRQSRPDILAGGVDIAARSVEMTTSEGFNASVLDISTTEIPGSYDYITCFEVLEHIPDAESALLRLKEAARSGIIVSVPNVGFIMNRLRLGVFGRFPITNCVFHINEHVRHWTPKDFADWANHHGLRIDRLAGQYGAPVLWRHRPTLFAAGMVYLLVAESAVDYHHH